MDTPIPLAGSSALILNTTGNSNTATGTHALISNTTGNSNTANGYHALFYNITGHENAGIGMYSGIWSVSKFVNRTYLGYDTNPSTAATIFVNSAAIGNLARFTSLEPSPYRQYGCYLYWRVCSLDQYFRWAL
ncbi:MAG: hypothetical protein IPM82_27715 [Saprospiraceae bacterium]|nr:hypothetical protein [Saprospiraceae bacterium]